MIADMKDRLKNKCCPFTGAYLPRLVPCVILGFAFIFGFNFFFHGQLLMGTYEQTPQLWRPAQDMQSHFTFMLLMQFLTAFLTALIYTQGHEGKGVCEGVRYGILIGLLLGILSAQNYGWMPISAELAQAWFLGGLLQGIGLGIIYSLIYKNPVCCAGKSFDSKPGGCCDSKGGADNASKTGCC